jgi:REP element-mobilizing transposase RayT
VDGPFNAFTVNLLERERALPMGHRHAFRTALRVTHAARPLAIVAIVVSLDHLRGAWRLPEASAGGR